MRAILSLPRVMKRAAYRLLVRWSNVFSRENLHRFIDRKIETLNCGGGPVRVLNIGAGGELGARGTELRNAQIITVAYDPDRRPDIVGDVSRLTMFGPESFDTVLMFEVLEHISTPQAAIDELHRVLKTEGRLILSTPFLFEIHDAPHDYYRYTKFGLHHLLREFKNVVVRPRNGYIKAVLVPLLRLWRSPFVADRCFGLLCLAASFPLFPFIFLLNRVIRWDAATTGYVVTCEK
ncbi:MAG TPA: class I SAM-dependent methyltransferase [Fuerstia sp.]|nr:class I SAM-dependent methyltransferase [Fuerstiella sp.]